MAEAIATKAENQRFVADLDKAHALGGPEWVQTIRSEAGALFDSLADPHHKMEAWRFTNVKPILSTNFESITAPTDYDVTLAGLANVSFREANWPELVFVDGAYAPELSNTGSIPENVVVESLAAALENRPAEIEPHLDKYLEKLHVFSAVNAAFIRDGAFIRIGKNAVPEQPIHVIYLTTDKAKTGAVYPRTLIIAESCAQARIIETHIAHNGADGYLTCPVTEIVLQEGAHMAYHKTIQEGPNAYHMASTKAHQERDSHFRSYIMSLEGQILRNELGVKFADTGCECDLFGLTLNEADRLIDSPLNIEHAAAQCRSRITYKNILDDKSHTVFTGMVHVRRDAQKTDSDQLNQTMLLNDGATIDTKPQLEIYADDVKCTHGATIGAAPEEIIFYFRSRGITEPMARAILTYGFASEVVGEIEVEALRDRLSQYVFGKYSPATGSL